MTTVSLTEDKLKAAGITTEPARVDRLSTEVGVVGVIQADSDRQVSVSAPAPLASCGGSRRARAERETRRSLGHAG